MSTEDTPKPVAEVCAGWTIRWVGSEPIATILGRNPSVRIGTMLFDQSAIDAAVAAAVAKERERCAKVLDDEADRQLQAWSQYIASGGKGPATSFHNAPRKYADMIRGAERSS